MSDVFRKQYKDLSKTIKHDMLCIKDKADELLSLLDSIAANNSVDIRAMALAKTNLEQSIMWAIKAIT